jgi:hypothetical protein
VSWKSENWPFAAMLMTAIFMSTANGLGNASWMALKRF